MDDSLLATGLFFRSRETPRIISRLSEAKLDWGPERGLSERGVIPLDRERLELLS